MIPALLFKTTSTAAATSDRRRGAVRFARTPARCVNGLIGLEAGLGVKCHVDDSLRAENGALVGSHILFLALVY